MASSLASRYPPTRQCTSPTHYTSQIQQLQAEGLPRDTEGWLSRARTVSSILASDAAIRDTEAKSPVGEVELLKASGLLKVLGPSRYGGGAQSWATGYKVIREVAKGDGSLGMLLGYHLLWSFTANVVGTEEQADGIQKAVLENNFLIGGAVNPRDADLKITSSADGQYIVFNGSKNFNTGGVVSDLTVLEGVYDGTDKHIFTFAKTDQPGIRFAHNWDALGMRLTESGSVKIDNVHVPWTDALGWDAKSRTPIPSILEVPFATLLLPTIQLVFSNFYIGIGLGSIDAALEYTRKNTRAWPYGGDDKEQASDEWYILERYGDFRAHALAAEALADKAGEQIAAIYEDVGGVSNSYREGATNGISNGYKSRGREAITAQRRGEVAALVASVKVVTTDTALRVSAGIYELLGSRATGNKYAFDRFWRNVRTHTLHDPVAYKRREVGRYGLLNEIPTPTWYT